MEIILSRHGEVDVDLWAWKSPRDIKPWIELYNRAPILVEAPPKTIAKAVESGVIVCSTLKRSIDSARTLCPERQALVEDIFREADLPYGHWPLPKLPLVVWGIWLRFKWFLVQGQSAESLLQAKSRARSAAERLVVLAGEHGTVFLVGHGMMNILIAEQLFALKWEGPKRPASGHWGFSVYRESGTGHSAVLQI